jgi:hypothetical protein
MHPSTTVSRSRRCLSVRDSDTCSINRRKKSRLSGWHTATSNNE